MSTLFTTPRRTLAGAIALAVGSLLLASCAAAPTPASTTAADVPSDFLPCIVSDSGGFNDNSFNALGLQGVTDAAKKLGVKHIDVQSNTESDYALNISSLIDQGCSVIVATGYLLAAATKEAAAANPDVNFIIIDDNSIDAPNVKPILFDTSQSGYLVGYAAASYTKTGKVGTFGGANIPPVTLYMDGFADGVARYNKDKGTDVKVIGWDLKTQEGQFTGNFTDINAAKVLSQTLLDQGADIILPVGGPIYQGTAEAIRDAGGENEMLGVDADMYEMAPKYSDMILTSIARDMPLSISTVIEADAAGDFTKDQYIGTLENGGVTISPFHDFEDKVAPTLAGELDALKAGIIDGSIVVDSPSKP